MFHESETSERMSWGEVIKCASGTEADRHNQYRMLKWMAAWGVSFVGGTALTNFRQVGSGQFLHSPRFSESQQCWPT